MKSGYKVVITAKNSGFITYFKRGFGRVISGKKVKFKDFLFLSNFSQTSLG